MPAGVFPPVALRRGVPRYQQLGLYYGDITLLTLPFSYNVMADCYCQKDGSTASDHQLVDLGTQPHPGGDPVVPLWGVILANSTNTMNFDTVITGQNDSFFTHQVDLMVQGGWGTGGANHGFPVLVRLCWEANIGTTPGGKGGSSTNAQKYSEATWGSKFQLAFQRGSSVMKSYAATKGVTMFVLWDYVQQSMGIPLTGWMPNPTSWDGIGMDIYTQVWGNTNTNWPGYASQPGLTPNYKGVAAPTNVTPPAAPSSVQWAPSYTDWWTTDFSPLAAVGGPSAAYGKNNAWHYYDFYNATASQPNGDVTSYYNAIQLCKANGKFIVHPELGTSGCDTIVNHSTNQGHGDPGCGYKTLGPGNPAAPWMPANDLNFYGWLQWAIAYSEDQGVPHLGGVMWNPPRAAQGGIYKYDQSGPGSLDGGVTSGSEYVTGMNLIPVAISGAAPGPSLSVNPPGTVAAGSTFTITVTGANYAFPTDITKLKVSLDGGAFNPVPAGGVISGSALTFPLTASSVNGNHTVAVEDTSQTPTLVAPAVTYSIAQTAPLGYAINVPATIPQQTSNQQYSIQAAFNYVPIQANIRASTSSGSASFGGLPSNATWSPDGRVVTIPDVTATQVPHFFGVIDTTFVPALPSAVITYQVGSTGGGGVVTVIEPPLNGPALSVSAPVTTQESFPGAGVTESITFTGANLISQAIWYSVLNASNVVVSGPTSATLGPGGQITESVFFPTSGCFVRAQNTNGTPAPTVTGDSSAIVITDGSATPTLSCTAPPLLNGTPPVNAPLVISATNLTGNVFWTLLSKAVGGTVLVGPTAAPLTVVGVNGTANITVPFAATGNVVFIGNTASAPTTTFTTSVVTINPPTAAFLDVSAPGQVIASTSGSGGTVQMSVTGGGLASNVFYWRILQASGEVELTYQTGALVGGAASFPATFLRTGDVMEVVDNTTAPTVRDTSDPVTVITAGSGPPQPAVITLPDPGTLIEPTVGSGATFAGNAQSYGSSGMISVGLYNASNVLQGSLTNTMLNTGAGPAITIPSVIPPQKGGQAFSVQVAFNYVAQPNAASIRYSQQSGGTLVYIALPAGATWDASGQLLTIPILNNTQSSHIFGVEDTALGINSGAGVTYVVGAAGGGGTVPVTPPTPLLTTIALVPFSYTVFTGWYVKASLVATPTTFGQSDSASVVDPSSMTPTLSVSAPQTIQVSAAGVVAQVPIAAKTTNVATGTTLYWQVITSTGIPEESFTPFVTTGATTDIIVPLGASGDVVKIVNAVSPATPTLSATSSAVTVTVAQNLPTITIQTPPNPIETFGTGAAVIAAQFMGSNLPGSSIQVQVRNPDGSVAADFVQVNLTAETVSQSVGQGQANFTITASGQYLYAVDNVANPQATATSDSVVLQSTNLSATITVFQPSPLNIGTQLISGIISAAGIQPVYLYLTFTNSPTALTTLTPGVVLATISPTGRSFTAEVPITAIFGTLYYSTNATASGGTWAQAWSAAGVPHTIAAQPVLGATVTFPYSVVGVASPPFSDIGNVQYSIQPKGAAPAFVTPTSPVTIAISADKTVATIAGIITADVGEYTLYIQDVATGVISPGVDFNVSPVVVVRAPFVPWRTNLVTTQKVIATDE